MFAATNLSPRTRNLAAGLIHRAWGWITTVGCVSPDDALGRRFHSLGSRSCLCFPPGSVFGESGIAIGAETLIGPHVSLSAGLPGQVPSAGHGGAPVVVIGDRCSIGRGSSIVGMQRIEIGDDVAIAPYVYITDHNHAYSDVELPIAQQLPSEGTVRIGAGSWLGTGVVVLPGSDIGRHVAVAAGSVVRGFVPDRSVVAGSPAQVVRRYSDEDGWQPVPRQPSPATPPA